MPWWSWRPGHAGGGEPEIRNGATAEGSVRVGVPVPRESEHPCVPADLSTIDTLEQKVE